jgi:hypothetical protein
MPGLKVLRGRGGKQLRVQSRWRSQRCCCMPFPVEYGSFVRLPRVTRMLIMTISMLPK